MDSSKQKQCTKNFLYVKGFKITSIHSTLALLTLPPNTESLFLNVVRTKKCVHLYGLDYTL